MRRIFFKTASPDWICFFFSFIIVCMKYLFFIFFIITNLSHSYANNQLLLHKEAKNIPDIKLNSLNYEDYSVLSASKKNLYIVNFWATWCAPCIKEIPDLILLKEKIGEDIEVFFISIDSNPSDSIPNFLKKNKIDFPHFYTDKKMKISRELDIKVMPTTLIINKEIQEISRVIGYIDWKNEEILNLIKKLI